jgi:hypothetical protein
MLPFRKAARFDRKLGAAAKARECRALQTLCEYGGGFEFEQHSCDGLSGGRPFGKLFPNKKLRVVTNEMLVDERV